MTNRQLSWIYGFSLLVIVGVLTALIAIGKVEEKSSFGLGAMIAILSGLAATWAHGQFGGEKK